MIVNETHTFKGSASYPKITVFSKDSKPNILHVTHKTTYEYSNTVRHSKHLLRLQPVVDPYQSVLDFDCRVSVNRADVCNFTGAFGNHATFLEIQEPYKKLEIVSRATVAVQEVSGRIDLLHQPRTLPLIWMPWDRIMMGAYLQPPELLEAELFELAEYAMTFVKKNHNNVYAMLVDMNETIFQKYSYVEGVTQFETTPYQVYRKREGVCQDFANLFICLCRLLDMPARYRVGYLLTRTDKKKPKASQETHAWVEVFCPYLGWLGFDPTNGCLAGKNHIRVACGRSYSDATPTSGTIFKSDGPARETLSTSVQVKKSDY